MVNLHIFNNDDDDDDETRLCLHVAVPQHDHQAIKKEKAANECTHIQKKKQLVENEPLSNDYDCTGWWNITEYTIFFHYTFYPM